MARREVHLWLRHDGEAPKAIAAGTCPPVMCGACGRSFKRLPGKCPSCPGQLVPAGKVVAVLARNVEEAAQVLSERAALVGRLGGEPADAIAVQIAASDPTGRLGFLLAAVRPVERFDRAYGEAS